MESPARGEDLTMTPKVFGLSFNDGSESYGLVELATYRLTCALCPWKGEVEAWRGFDDPEPDTSVRIVGVFCPHCGNQWVFVEGRKE